MGLAKEDVGGTKSLVNKNGATSFGIGIGDYPVRPIDQAVGFATFADGGVAHEGYLVQKVTDAQGRVLLEHNAKPRRAIDARVANDVTLTLEPVAGFSGVGLDGRESASKTGTEGIPSGPDEGKNSDAWMVGFTPQVSAAVWVGSGDSAHAIYSAGGGNEYGRDLPGKAWKLFMDTYLSGKPSLPLSTTQQITAGQDLSLPPAPTPTPTPTTSTPTPTASPTPTPSQSTPPPSIPTRTTVTPTPSTSTATRTKSRSPRTKLPFPTISTSTPAG
jgi:membrane peptidoglycan carboxypeptidase